MKKITLLGALLVAATMQAQKTFYWPGQRVSELTDGQQYFIYNTAITTDGQDRTNLLYSNGSTLKTNKVKPSNFITSDPAYLFKTIKPEGVESTNHWYLNSLHGIVGIGGQTNNTEIRDLYITPWTNESPISRASVNSEPSDLGSPADPNTTTVWTITKTGEANPNANNNTNDGYAWNGNPSEWGAWCTAHPYAFYSIGSKTFDEEASAGLDLLYQSNGALAEAIAYMQENYGLVKDGNKYFSNKPEDPAMEPSSYANLVDGDDQTYFHTSWSNSGSDPHFLRAELQTAPSSFRFITKRRMQNNNARPTKILIEGSNDDTQYEEITTLTAGDNGLPFDEKDYFYVSKEITPSTPYRYIRFTVLNTSTNNIFFHYSEFYVIENNDEVNKLCNLYENKIDVKTSSVTNESVIAAANDLNIFAYKKIGQELLDATEEQHQKDPAIGYYETAKRSALETAISSSITDANVLIDAYNKYKASLNAYVFTITSANAGAYSDGSSIYDDNSGTLKWKATNKYDKSMLWKFEDATANNITSGQNYVVSNLSTANNFWGADFITVNTNANGKYYFTLNGIVPEDLDNINGGCIHAAAAGNTIVKWNANAPASTWTFEYVGESKNIDAVDEQKLAEFGELSELITACEPFEGKIGTGLNQFTSENFETALSAAKDVAAKDIYTNPNLDITDTKNSLKAAKEALTINQPEPGKYYRIKSVAKNKYISSIPVNDSDNRPKLIDEADESTVYYLSADKRLTSAKAQNINKDSRPSATDLGTTFDFLINNNGYYLIKSTERNEPLYPHYDNGDLLSYDWQGGSFADKLVDAWILEEVTDEASLPKLTKTMTDEYATIAAPVALNIPSGVKAYTAKVNGDKATLTEISGDVIPAGVAAVIKKTGAESSYEFTFAPAGVSENESDLQGVYATYNVPADTKAYVLANKAQGIGFYLLNAEDRTLAANKAYLVAPAEASGIKAFTFDFGGTTGIDNPETAVEAEEYYDLQGRRVMNPTKGIYVTKSGKKVLFTK